MYTIHQNARLPIIDPWSNQQSPGKLEKDVIGINNNIWENSRVQSINCVLERSDDSPERPLTKIVSYQFRGLRLGRTSPLIGIFAIADGNPRIFAVNSSINNLMSEGDNSKKRRSNTGPFDFTTMEFRVRSADWTFATRLFNPLLFREYLAVLGVPWLCVLLSCWLC